MDFTTSEDGTTTLLDLLPSDALNANDEAETNELDEFLRQEIYSLPEKLKLPFIAFWKNGRMKNAHKF